MKIATRYRYVKKIPVLEVVLEKERNEALPLIIYYHGWQSSKELVLTQARKLAGKGFRVVLPDAMHHGERRSGPISQIPSVTFWSSIQYNLFEFTQLIQYFEAHGLIKADLIGVGGVSMGGITTSCLLTQHPEIKVAACIMGTPSPLKYLERVMNNAKEMSAFIPQDAPLLLVWLANYDLSIFPERLANRPVLFWHGTEDEKIPYEDVDDFFSEIEEESYSNNTEFLIGQGEGHLVKGSVMDMIAEFFAEELRLK